MVEVGAKNPLDDSTVVVDSETFEEFRAHNLWLNSIWSHIWTVKSEKNKIEDILNPMLVSSKNSISPWIKDLKNTINAKVPWIWDPRDFLAAEGGSKLKWEKTVFSHFFNFYNLQVQLLMPCCWDFQCVFNQSSTYQN